MNLVFSIQMGNQGVTNIELTRFIWRIKGVVNTGLLLWDAPDNDVMVSCHWEDCEAIQWKYKNRGG